MQKIVNQSTLRTFITSIILILWLTVSPVTAFFWSLLLLWATFKLDTRIVGYGAVALLVLIPIVLSTKLYEWMAEQLAVYVFYLLCITVVLQMLELYRDPESNANDTMGDQVQKPIEKADTKGSE